MLTILPASLNRPRSWHTQPPAQAWEDLLASFAGMFTKPSFLLFRSLITAWALCPGRRTVTRMITIADPEGKRAHDAYHRFLRAGAWNMGRLWCHLAVLLVAHLNLPQRLVVYLDDTLFHKTGRKVKGAGNFRDPIRSTGKKVVYALGLNLVVLTIRVRPPWGGEPLALPINMRLYRKGGPSHLDLTVEMIEEVAHWLPGHTFVLGADGAYASLAGRQMPRTHLVSRMRIDAAVFNLAPQRQPGQRGRPRKKGDRLPSLPEIARLVPDDEWDTEIIEVRGQKVERLIFSMPVLWYAVCPDHPVLLVIVRDPNGKQKPDFLFSTDLDMPPREVAAIYADRWSIEDTFKNTKQFLGGQEPQSWSHHGPERAAALSLWLYSLVALWHLVCHGDRPTWTSRPWFTSKTTPSFADALATLRRALWPLRLFGHSDSSPLLAKIPNLFIDTLAEAA